MSSAKKKLEAAAAALEDKDKPYSCDSESQQGLGGEQWECRWLWRRTVGVKYSNEKMTPIEVVKKWGDGV